MIRCSQHTYLES